MVYTAVTDVGGVVFIHPLVDHKLFAAGIDTLGFNPFLARCKLKLSVTDTSKMGYRRIQVGHKLNRSGQLGTGLHGQRGPLQT